MMNEFNELILKRDVLAAIRKEMPINRMDTDEEVAMERLYHKIVAKVEQLPTEESTLQREMKKRNMTEADILEYMKFEDTCVLKGFTLKGLLEAGEKQKAKRPYWALDRQQESAWMNCPCCQRKVTAVNKCCPTCGQKLDWKVLDRNKKKLGGRRDTTSKMYYIQILMDEIETKTPKEIVLDILEYVQKQKYTPTTVSIQEWPAVGAVLDVVRCKDCKKSVMDGATGRRMCIKTGEIRPNGHVWGGIAVGEEHFCGYGERRDENETETFRR